MQLSDAVLGRELTAERNKVLFEAGCVGHFVQADRSAPVAGGYQQGF